MATNNISRERKRTPFQAYALQSLWAPLSTGATLDNVKIDYCLPLAEIGPLLVRLANDPFEEERSPIREAGD